MSVVGIDFGSQSTKIGVARNKGIDIITNEVSNRSTPSLVGFGPKSRYIGEAAKTQEISNLKNTVGTLRRLAGRSFKDPDVQVEQDYNTATLIDINGEAGAEVSYLGKKEQFTATQLVAMFLTKIKTTVASELKLPVADVVLSVPPWFTDAQRRSLLDASEIAGLTCLRLINDSTAIALGWGITKFDLPSAEEKPRRVAFVDIGHSDYTCSIVEFRKGELNVKATTYDRHFGGRNFDKALVDHFAKEFKEKFKIDIRTNLKAWTRTLAAAEKLKKILSANASAPMSIESLMDDVDVRSFVKREELEAMIQPLLDRVTVPLEQALAEAKLKPEDIDSIEMVGGCTRIPIIKEKISEFFGKPLSFTLNQDEAVARGCAFSCATLSPVFRVRDFSVHDIVNYPIEFTWEQAPEIPDEATSLTVFNKGNVMPSTKILTFYRKQPFDIEARYAKPEGLPGKANPWIGRFSVKGVTPNPDGDFATCKLRARLNLHGILNIESGYYVEDVEVEEPIPEKEGEKNVFSNMRKLWKQAMDTDAPNGEAAEAKPKMRKVKKQVRKGDLPISSGTAGLDDWLYEDGEDTTKAVYIAKMDEIRFVAGPIIQRHADKVEAERMAAQKAQEEAAAKKRAEQEAAKKNAAPAAADTEMKDADSASPGAGDEPMPEVEEAS
ncbi:hsp88-like protein [Histoplasma capsulatum G186AR]|uniref:Hsp88-like protein n=2 Tax=Ajellomyces capsulatus TaxID=5037 RepID=C0NNM5_AJECG|nr:hsp88-like protein [Histoplasma capsulatum G186AR]EEH06535.1 hsp88-like protein [Histoplasma capsulatum G186AR]EER40716.1 hsp88-like protein [Histoplasma capsulatum H143]